VEGENMTEQEARTKQCWHKFIMCIASDCMAWTWDVGEYEYSGGKVDDSGWEEVAVGYWRKKRENREGFCGFGGSL